MPHSIERFLLAAQSLVHPLAHAWLTPARIDANLREEVSRSLDRTRDEGAPDALRARLIPLSGALAGERAIATLLRKAPGPGEPAPGRAFVSIDHLTFEIDSADRLRACIAQARAAFPGQAHADVRIYQRAGPAFDIGAAPDARTDKRLYAAPASLIRSAPRPAHYDQVGVEPASDLAFYDNYARLYRQMHQERPDLASEVPVETLEDMADYLAQRTLFHIVIAGRRAGVMAARRDVFAGLHGYRVLEKFLHPEFRGRGLAAAAQRRFAEAVDASDSELIFGFIHPTNPWSIRAAAHDRRVDVGGHTLIASDPGAPPA